MDQGSEFREDFKQFINQIHFGIYHTFRGNKNLLAETCIRNLKLLLYKILEENGSDKYINCIQKLMKLLNVRINGTIGMAPVRVRE